MQSIDVSEEEVNKNIHDVIHNLMYDISESLEEAWEEAEDESIQDLAFNIVEHSKTAILADILADWKETGLSKEEFIAQLKQYGEFTGALVIMILAAVIAAEQIIPGEDE